MDVQISFVALQVGEFTPAFLTWFAKELGNRIELSQAFVSKYGRDNHLLLAWVVLRRFKKPRIVFGHALDYKRISTHICLPFRCTTSTPTEYAKVVNDLLDSLATVLKQMDIDPTRVIHDAPKLIAHFITHPEMLEVPPAEPKRKSLPAWKIPKNIQKRVDDEDGMWEDERFDPILLTVMSGVEYEGRDIPLSWQIEFDPFDDRLETANEKLETSGIEPDGDGWAEVIEKKFTKRYPKLAGELHSDSESSTCVLWVESEDACKKLIGLVWSLIHPK